MTTQEKTDIHEALSAFRITRAIDLLLPHVSGGADERSATTEELAAMRGRYEHYNVAHKAEYGPQERRRQNDELVKSLQLILSRITINDKPRSLTDIIGRDLDEDFLERERVEKTPPPPPPPSGKGFFGEIEFTGSPTQKRKDLRTQKSYGAAYHLCVQTLKKFNVELERGDRDGGRIYGGTPGNSLARFGEQVLLWLTPDEQGNTAVTIIVDSKLPDTAFDMGRHQRLLDQLAHAIQYG